MALMRVVIGPRTLPVPRLRLVHLKGTDTPTRALGHSKKSYLLNAARWASSVAFNGDGMHAIHCAVVRAHARGGQALAARAENRSKWRLPGVSM